MPPCFPTLPHLHPLPPLTASPAAQTFLPSLGDVITTPVTQVTVSAEGIVGAFDQTQWPSLHTNKPTVQLQTKKRGQSLSISPSQVNYALSNCIICLIFIFQLHREKTSTQEGRISNTGHHSEEGQI